MTITKPESVVVIGAGVTGLSTAFHLREKGVEQVTVIDKGTVGGGSSLQSGGIITMLLDAEPVIKARGISIDFFERFSKILDGYQFHQVGCLNLFTTEALEGVSKNWDLQKKLGARFEVLHGKEITDRFPNLEAKEGEHGVLDLKGGYSEPHKYIPALRAKLEDMGVEFRENEKVTGFNISDDRVTGVVTSKGTLEAEAFVCAVNAWANHVLSMAGFKIPFKNFIHERFVTKPLVDPVRLPAVNDHILNAYIRPTDDNRLLLGSGDHDSQPFEMHGPDFKVDELEPDPRALPHLKQHIVKRTPSLSDIEWDYHTVGLISLAYDVKPVIGPVPGIAGLFVGTNFHSGGFAYNPSSGLLIAEHVVEGKTRFNTDIYSPDRFRNVDVDSFLSEPIMHNSMGRVRH
tara:strand:+ start:8764 stop:9969 length:1206 start_codon:yes stop_codon:yes gene_type:complete